MSLLGAELTCTADVPPCVPEVSTSFVFEASSVQMKFW